MKKAFALFAVALICLASLCACGSQNGPSGEELSMYDLSRAMLAATTFGDMTYVSSNDDGADNLFTYISALSYDKVAQFFLSYATDGKGNADEIAVIRVKSAQDLDEAVKSLQAHLQKRIHLYREYDPKQSEKIEKGIVFAEKDMAVLIVSNDNGAVKNAFKQFLG